MIGTLAAIGRLAVARLGCWTCGHDWKRWAVKQPSALRWTPWYCLRCGAIEENTA